LKADFRPSLRKLSPKQKLPTLLLKLKAQKL